MSTENNANEQNVSSRRGPDPRFVWGLVAVVILCGILYAGYTKNSSLKKELDNSVSKEEYNKLETKLQEEKANLEKQLQKEKADLEKQVADLQKDKENAQTDIESLKNEKDELDNKLKKWESYPGARRVIRIKGESFVFRWCPAGTFTMGSADKVEVRHDDETLHKVKLTRGFWMSECEVTQKQWRAIMGTNPEHITNDEESKYKDHPDYKNINYPVEGVSWNDCQEFCKKFSAESGLSVQLPTEAQWEYACDAWGTSTLYYGPDMYAWYIKNSNNTTNKVVRKASNMWGLYDMLGNVWEWCHDYYGKYPTDDITEDPTGPESGDSHVIRGGGFNSGIDRCRPAARAPKGSGEWSGVIGFRIVINP